MTLDLYAFAPRPGEDVSDAIERLETEDDLRAPDAAARARNDRLAAALRATLPRMREHRAGRGLALVGELLELYLSAQYAVVTVDYARAQDRVALSAEAYRAARAITAETGWSVFDAHGEQPISPVADSEDYRRVFDAALRAEEAPRPSLLARLFGRAS
jgi:hypothetical protein